MAELGFSEVHSIGRCCLFLCLDACARASYCSASQLYVRIGERAAVPEYLRHAREYSYRSSDIIPEVLSRVLRYPPLIFFNSERPHAHADKGMTHLGTSFILVSSYRTPSLGNQLVSHRYRFLYNPKIGYPKKGHGTA